MSHSVGATDASVDGKSVAKDVVAPGGENEVEVSAEVEVPAEMAVLQLDFIEDSEELTFLQSKQRATNFFRGTRFAQYFRKVIMLPRQRGCRVWLDRLTKEEIRSKRVLEACAKAPGTKGTTFVLEDEKHRSSLVQMFLSESI